MTSNGSERKQRKKLSNFESFQINITSNNTALLLIDIQEKLVKVIPNNKTLIVNIKKIIDASALMELRIYLTEQNPKKLGGTISAVIPQSEFKKYTKSQFSCIECSNLIDDLINNNIKNILVCGIESHICILQSSIDLIRNNFNVYIISDAIQSRKIYDHEISLIRLRDSGAIISTTETSIFELCKTADHKDFKGISKIIKRLE